MNVRIRMLFDTAATQKGVEPGDVEVGNGIGAIGRAEARRHAGQAGTMRRQIEQRDFLPRRPRQAGRRNQLPHRLVESDRVPPRPCRRAAAPVNGFVRDPIWKIESGAAAP